ncbi:hypothetical protein BGZ52_004341 [Haplosporangium bisporale]|nr:hypothetical protein BGZ52_004341 [Haplosporangium bisporale]KFH71153.1 hypothetical protein MVEG_03999 [Podila verticillata NRRL 6337]
MSSEPQSRIQTDSQIDKRVPPEIWERIFNHLYPSQLSRMSMVNKNLYKIVSSLSVWSRMFSVVFGPTERLRTLRNIPESKSHMLYMCASSLRVCEGCLKLAPWDATVYHRTLPMPVLVRLPTMTKGGVHYLGEEINLHWRVRMCTACGQKQFLDSEGGIDEKTKGRIHWYRTQP